MTSRIPFIVASLLLLLLTALVYWPGLNGPLILDDISNLDILRVLDEQGRLTFANVLAERGGILGGRPVSWLTFILNWKLAAADVWSFKLVNLLIHLANGILVFVAARLVFAACPHLERVNHAWFALAVAGLWLLTPLQVSAVLYVVQRMAMLSTLFALFGLVAYGFGRQRLQQSPRHGVALIGLALVVFWPLSALSKQNGVLLPLLLLATELLVYSLRDDIRWPRFLLTAIVASIIGVGCVRVLLDPQWVLDTYPLREFTLEQRLLTQPRVLLDYALNVVQLPGGSPLALFHDDFVISTSLFSPLSTLPALLAVLSVPLAAWRLRGHPLGVALFGLLFFLVAHSLEAGPFALEMYFEHRNYLPSFGLWLSLGFLAALAVQRLEKPRLLAILVAIVMLGHAAITFTRVSLWTSFEEIVTANAATHPHSLRARAGAAIVAFTRGQLDRGLAELDAVRTLGGARADVPVALKSLTGFCLTETPPPPHLLRQLESARTLAVDPYTVAALRWFRSVSEQRGCPGLDAGAVPSRLIELIALRRDARNFGFDWVLYEELSALLEADGRTATAADTLRKAIPLAPASRRPAMRTRLRSLERAERA